MLKTVSTLLVTLGILTGSGIASAYEGDRAPTVAVHDYRNDDRGYRRDDRPSRPPPPPRVERVRVRAGFAWVPGAYAFRAGRYVWVGGHWERDRPNRRFVPGHWDLRDGRYAFMPGFRQHAPSYRR